MDVDENKLRFITLRRGESSAKVYEHGAHVTSWVNGSLGEQLFLSSKALFAPPKAIRGGIPICFPQFSDFGKLGQHGFARNKAWEVASVSDDGSSAVLRLRDSPATLEEWPHSFEASYQVSLMENGSLRTALSVRNTGEGPMEFTVALHTYFRVKDLPEVRVSAEGGLSGTDYLDNLSQRNKVTQTDADVAFDKEVDRIYLSTPDTMELREGPRTVRLKKTNLPDSVVWNPWIEKARSLADFGDDEYLEMVCIEPAAIGTPVRVGAGDTWEGSQEISVAMASQ